MRKPKFYKCPFWIALMVLSFTHTLHAQTVDELKNLSLEELMNIEVTSVSKRPEKLLTTPSAIQVVTNDDILKYGASNIPEALYLAGNLQVAQKGSSSYGISARGFNTDLANKLLVLIDGRTVYTPLFSGVYWDRQDYLLQDISQIEVISGPGGTLWGANAVNGVINITSKSAKDTQGGFAEIGGGNELKSFISTRYGGTIRPNIYYRVYGKYADRDASTFPDSVDAHNGWNILQGGFRIDAERASNDNFTLQGDIYRNKADLTAGGTSEVVGANILGRWSHSFSENSGFKLQTYLDYTNLDMPTPAFVSNGLELAPEGVFKDKLNTFDIDFQHQIKMGKNILIWGGGYRHLNDNTTNSPSLGFIPENFDQDLYNIFIQDEISLLPTLTLTGGTKLEHNPYTNFVWEPSARIKWDVNKHGILWAALSQAVRTPSRIDRQLSQGTPPYFVLLAGSPDFISETVVSTELGYRMQIGQRATLSVSTFYNQYDDVRSTELNPTTIFPLFFQNGLEGETYGAELSLAYNITDKWQWYSTYNLLREDIRIKEGKSDFSNALNETADPKFQFTTRMSYQLLTNLSVGAAFRWVDKLPINDSGNLKFTPAYAEMDAQIAWIISKNFTLSVAGRNLLHKDHAEYGIPNNNMQAIQRSVYGKLSVRF